MDSVVCSLLDNDTACWRPLLILGKESTILLCVWFIMRLVWLCAWFINLHRYVLPWLRIHRRFKVSETEIIISYACDSWLQSKLNINIAQCDFLNLAQSISRKRCSWQVAMRIQGGHAHWLPQSSLVCREVKTLPVSVLRVPARLRFSFPEGSWKVGVCCTCTLLLQSQDQYPVISIAWNT